MAKWFSSGRDYFTSNLFFGSLMMFCFVLPYTIMEGVLWDVGMNVFLIIFFASAVYSEQEMYHKKPVVKR